MKDWSHAAPARPPCSRKHMYKFANEYLNNSEENWVKLLCSDETKFELFGINSTHRVWRRNAAYDPKNTIPTIKCGGWKIMLWGVFLLRGQDNCLLYNWKRDDERGHVPSGPGHWKWVGDGNSSMTMTQNTRPRQQRSDSRRSTLRSWSGLASLQTLIP